MRPMIRLITVGALFLGTSNVPLFAQRFHVAPMRQPLSPNVMFFFGFPPGGNFVRATSGNFVAATDSFVPARTGSSVLTARGFFMPTQGTFVPSRSGNFVLTTREAFDPKRNTLVPSATGNFVVSARGNLVSSTTKMAVDSFVPLPPITVPNTFVNPYNPPLAMSNPYMMAMSGASAYPMSPYVNPYAAPYGNSTPASTMTAAVAKIPSDTAGDKQTQVALGAYGIPTEDGHVKWPLAFRLLPPEKKSELTDTLESQLLAIAKGSINSAILRGAKQNVQRLSAWLSEHQTNLAEVTYQDGRDFLVRVDATLSGLAY